MLKKYLKSPSATSLGYISILLVLLMALVLVFEFQGKREGGPGDILPSGSPGVGRVEKIVAGLRNALISQRASGEELAAFKNSESRLGEIFSQYPERDQAVVLKYLLAIAGKMELSREQMYSLYDYHSWQDGSLQKFWSHVFDNLDNMEWKPVVFAFARAVAIMRDNSWPDGDKVLSGYALGGSNDVLVFGPNSLFYLEDARSREFQWKPYRDLWALKRVYYGNGTIDLILVDRQQDGPVKARPVNLVQGLTFSANLDKALSMAGESIAEPLPVHSLVCARDSSAMVFCSDSSLGYWQWLPNGQESGWSFSRIKIADVETVFWDSRIRSGHVSLIFRRGYVEFDNLTAGETAAFAMLAKAVGGVNSGAALQFPAAAVANRYYLYEFPSVVEYISRQRILDDGEVIVSLVVANSALSGDNQGTAANFQDRVIKWLSGLTDRLATRLGIGSSGEDLSRGPVPFAALTDRRFFACVDGEVKYYDLADGIPFAIKRDDVSSQSVDFFERDFFDEDKPLLDNVHENLVPAFQVFFRQVVSGAATGVDTNSLEQVLSDHASTDSEQPPRQEMPPSSLVAVQDSTGVVPRENELGYAGMVKSFLEQGTFEENRELLQTLQAASGIDDQRAQFIVELIKDQLRQLFTIMPNEQGFAGMVERFSKQGSLQQNARLLEQLAAASGISEQRRKEISEWVLERLQRQVNSRQDF